MKELVNFFNNFNKKPILTNERKREIIRALVRHCLEVYPGHNVMVMHPPHETTNLENVLPFDEHTVEIKGAFGSWSLRVFVFKSGTITNVENQRGSSNWGFYFFYKFFKGF